MGRLGQVKTEAGGIRLGEMGWKESMGGRDGWDR